MKINFTTTYDLKEEVYIIDANGLYKGIIGNIKIFILTSGDSETTYIVWYRSKK